MHVVAILLSLVWLQTHSVLITITNFGVQIIPFNLTI